MPPPAELPDGARDAVKTGVEAMGLDAKKFGSHSMRAGWITSAARNGANVFKMKEISRHKSTDVPVGYVRGAKLFDQHAWEWLQREVDIFGTFEVGHYRPKDHPNAVRVVHEKTGEENWIPLFDEQTGAPFFPVLISELGAVKRTRIAGLMLRRDWGKHDPWPTFPKEDEI